jgi:hypothetical protein
MSKDIERDSGEFVSLVKALYKHALRRQPGADELKFWTKRCTEASNLADVIESVFSSKEYMARFWHQKLPYQPGHFYSPVVVPSSLDPKLFKLYRNIEPGHLLGLDLNFAKMREFWLSLVPALNLYPFPEKKTETSRYFWKNGVYEFGDSAILFSILDKLKPKNIIEIGSGFSSACMLQTAEFFNLPTTFTFIDPNPQRLYGLLRPDDHARCKIIPRPVQTIELRVFEKLETNDILFIDSSHVSKTGSDVNFEIFEVLPRIKPGVFIHFHDCFYPFEYPVDWIFNRKISWNELYVLRAFLMYNEAFDVKYFNDAFVLKERNLLQTGIAKPILDNLMHNPGGGLWLKRR